MIHAKEVAGSARYLQRGERGRGGVSLEVDRQVEGDVRGGHLGSGRIVTSEIFLKAPNLFVHLVSRGGAVVQSDDATET